MNAPTAGALARRGVAFLLALQAAACAADVPQTEVLPGHSRPVLEHDWPHPRDLAFADSGFRPTDAATALVITTSGVRAYVLPDTADPLAEITAVVPLGRQFEGDDEVGAADAAARVLGQLLANRLGDEIVARTQVSPGGDLTRMTVEVLAEDWRPALAALVGALRAFDGATITSSRTGGGPGGASAARATAELMRLVARYPIAPPQPGVEVRADAVRGIGRRALQPGVVVLGIAGNVPRTEAEAALRAAIDGWTPAPDPSLGVASGVTPVGARKPTLEAARPLPDALHTVDVPGFMSWLAVGQPMPPIAAEDAAAVAVMKEIVNIRLNITTREIRGLTNRALLELPAASDGAGLLYVRAGSRSESVGPIIRYAAEELSRIREAEGAPDVDELEQAKGGLVLGAWQASLDGARRTAATYATETVRHGSVENLMHWPAAVGAVTASDVTAAARKYIDPRSLTAVVVGQIELVRAARHPRWPFALDDVPGLLRPSGTGE